MSERALSDPDEVNAPRVACRMKVLLHLVPLSPLCFNRYACLALGQLAIAMDSQKEISRAWGIEALTSSLDCDDEETRFNACYALNKLAMNSENFEARHGCVKNVDRKRYEDP